MIKASGLSTNYRIIGDIGGTNARFALVDDDLAIVTTRVLRCADYAGITNAIQAFLNELQLADNPHEACIAVACPVTSDRVKLTNHVWGFSINEVKLELGLERLEVVNDYTALAHSIPCLPENDLFRIGRGKIKPDLPKAILGPGTGMGLAGLVKSSSGWVSIATEGGHVSFAPCDDLEYDILRYMRHRFTRVSIERILSGPGIEALYQALASIRGVPTKPLSSADITRLGLAHSCPVCTETLDRFCTILGSFAGDVALTLGALGGVYITGGIVPRFLDYLKNSRFRERFEAKGRFDNYMQAIPTYVVTAKFPGLTGAAAILGSNHQI